MFLSPLALAGTFAISQGGPSPAQVIYHALIAEDKTVKWVTDIRTTDGLEGAAHGFIGAYQTFDLKIVPRLNVDGTITSRATIEIYTANGQDGQVINATSTLHEEVTQAVARTGPNQPVDITIRNDRAMSDHQGSNLLQGQPQNITITLTASATGRPSIPAPIAPPDLRSILYDLTVTRPNSTTNAKERTTVGSSATIHDGDFEISLTPIGELGELSTLVEFTRGGATKFTTIIHGTSEKRNSFACVFNDTGASVTAIDQPKGRPIAKDEVDVTVKVANITQ